MKPINSVPEKEEKMWSTEFPQVEDGVYWIRYHEGGDADIGQLSCGLVQVAGGAFISDSRHRIEYLGPISPSDTEELLALREAVTVAIDQAERASLVQDRSVHIIKQACALIASELRKALGKE